MDFISRSPRRSLRRRNFLHQTDQPFPGEFLTAHDFLSGQRPSRRPAAVKKMTMRMPGNSGDFQRAKEKGSRQSAGPHRPGQKGSRRLPNRDRPNPPTTMMISKLKVKKKVKSPGEMVVIKWASSPPATPPKKPLMVKAIILYRKARTPMASPPLRPPGWISSPGQRSFWPAAI